MCVFVCVCMYVSLMVMMMMTMMKRRRNNQPKANDAIRVTSSQTRLFRVDGNCSKGFDSCVDDDDEDDDVDDDDDHDDDGEEEEGEKEG